MLFGKVEQYGGWTSNNPGVAIKEDAIIRQTGAMPATGDGNIKMQLKAPVATNIANCTCH